MMKRPPYDLVFYLFFMAKNLFQACTIITFAVFLEIPLIGCIFPKLYIIFTYFDIFFI